MSYENPQIQTFSNEGIFQNLQQTISAAASSAANTFITQAKELKEEKQRQAQKIDDFNTTLISKTQTVGGKYSQAAKNSKLPINLFAVSQVAKSKYYDFGSELGPGKDKAKAGDAIQGMEEIDNYPDLMTEMLSMLATETDVYRNGAQDGNLSTSFKTKEPGLVQALGSLAYLAESGAEIETPIENINWKNPSVNVKYKDDKGEWKTQPITRDDLLKWKNSGGAVKLIPNSADVVENIQKKATNIYEAVTAKGKDGQDVQELTGRISPEFLMPNTREDVQTQDITVEGKKVTQTVGLMVQDINIAKIEKDPVFQTSVDAAAKAIFTDPWEAYSMNEDVFLKQMPGKGMIDLPEPNFEGDGAAQKRADWLRDFKANLTKYQIENLKAKPYQPVLNSEGKAVSRTWQSPDSTGGKNNPNQPTEADEKRNYAIKRIKAVTKAKNGRIVGTKGFILVNNGKPTMYRWKGGEIGGAFEAVPVGETPATLEEMAQLQGVYELAVGGDVK